MVAMHGDLVAGIPQTHGATNAKNDTRSIGAKNVLVEVVTLCPHTLFAQPSQGAKGADWLKDAAPHRVEVDGRRHHCNHHFVGSKFGQRDFANMDALAGVLVLTWNAFPHVLVFLADIRGAVRGGQWQGGNLLASSPIKDGLKDVFHSSDDSDFPPIIS